MIYPIYDNTQCELTDLRVLITRPATQANTLIQMLNEAHAIPRLLPMVAIHSRFDDPSLTLALNAYDAAEYLIFTSVNAVTHAIMAIKQAKKQWPPSKIIFAVGSTTRDCLQDQGCTEVIIPDGKFCSENLLHKIASYPIRDKLMIIFGGAHPRSLLESTLKKQNAQVLHAICYERHQEVIKMDLTQQHELLDSIDVFVFTSDEILVCFMQIICDELHDQLFKKPFLIISRRMHQTLQRMGYTKSPIIADNPTDSGIMAALTHWYEEYHHG
ncbi:MAG: uroporphyrinogen-III synthase [Legionellales bacterium]|nr:uroporphyrinogen-III synthase [Legionellales bacterium]